MSNGSSISAAERGVNEFFAMFERAQAGTAIDRVYGPPFERDGKLVVPVASVGQFFGLGGGIGSDRRGDQIDDGAGGGGGGFAGARPVALAEIDANGVQVHAIVDENRALAVSLAFAAWAVFWTARTLIKIFKP